MNSKDKEIVRELAARYMEAACSEEQKKMNAAQQKLDKLQSMVK